MDTKYISVPVDLAEKIEAMKGDDMLMSRAVDKYFQWSVDSIAENLKALDETVVQYRGLNAKARDEFSAAALDVSEKSHQVWDDWHASLPVISQKVKSMCDEIAPLKNDLDEINGIIKEIDTWRVDRVLKTMKQLSDVDEEVFKMIAFLMQNYNR